MILRSRDSINFVFEIVSSKMEITITVYLIGADSSFPGIDVSATQKIPAVLELGYSLV